MRFRKEHQEVQKEITLLIDNVINSLEKEGGQWEINQFHFHMWVLEKKEDMLKIQMDWWGWYFFPSFMTPDISGIPYSSRKRLKKAICEWVRSDKMSVKNTHSENLDRVKIYNSGF